jgi:uncharacterized protein
MKIKEEIKLKLEDFLNLCKAHNVKSIYAFGSSTTEKFDPNTSDIDLVVELDVADPLERGEKLMNLWDKFELFFKRKVDLLTESSIKNPVLKSNIEKTKILIYDGKRGEIFV